MFTISRLRERLRRKPEAPADMESASETEMAGRGTERRRLDECNTLSKVMNRISKEKPAEFTIYKVNSHVRSVNVKAYEPEVVSIGPYHHGKENLMMMQVQKFRSLHSLVQSKPGERERFVSAIKAMEPQARKCYAEGVELREDDFVHMLLLDCCFIIQLVQNPIVMQSNDPIFCAEWIIESLQRDLMLFENQVPFFVLCKLYELITNDNNNVEGRLIELLMKFFKSLLRRDLLLNIPAERQSPGPMHLLELIHPNPALWSLVDWSAKWDTGEKPKMTMINTASQLTEANVKFERVENLPLFDIKFENGTIKMAQLTIEPRTESIYRNLIAYELYFCQGASTYLVTDYIKFLDSLVNSSKDVEILSKYGIIENWLGDDEVVANMFNRLTESVLTGPGKSSRYEELFNGISKHCTRRRNRWMAKLRRNYLNSPWAIISVIAAIVLLLLTVTQTVLSVLQVVLKK